MLAFVAGIGLFGCGKEREQLEITPIKLLNQDAIKADKHFVDQETIRKALEQEVEKDYTLEKPFTVVDPYRISPLTAVAIFKTSEPSKITVEVEGKDAFSGIKHTFKSFSKKHMVPIYGLYANKANKVILKATDKSGKVSTKVLMLETEALPTDISKTQVKVNKKAVQKAGFTFVDCPHVNGNYQFAIDCNGDIRWYLSEKKYNGSVMLTHLKNGNMLISNGEPIPNTYNNLPTVFEISPLGYVGAAYNVYGIHHDIREKKNGNLIMAASIKGRPSQNDAIVEVERNTGKIINTWDLREILPMTEYKADSPYGGGTSNWFHNNAVWLNEEKNEFIISGRHQNTVAKFDAKTKELKWILSKTIGVKNAKLEKYLLKADGEAFEFPTAQHAAMELPDGKLMLFDNTNFDIVNSDKELIQNKMYSRAVIYDIDEKAKTVKQVWQYGKERGQELYSSYISDVDYLGPDHYLLDFGGKYIAKDGKVYDHMFTPKKIKNASKRQSTIIEILKGDVVWEVELLGNSNSNTYKAERKNIYQGL